MLAVGALLGLKDMCRKCIGSPQTAVSRFFRTMGQSKSIRCAPGDLFEFIQERLSYRDEIIDN